MEIHIEEDKIICTQAFVWNANSAVRACWSAFCYYGAKPGPGYFRDRLILEGQGHGVFITQLWKCPHGEWQMVLVEILLEQAFTSWAKQRELEQMTGPQVWDLRLFTVPQFALWRLLGFIWHLQFCLDLTFHLFFCRKEGWWAHGKHGLAVVLGADGCPLGIAYRV